jgi:cbb3-type cytochrome c oxidase subunit III
VDLFGLKISTELVGAIFIPTIFLIVVLALPWIDRATTRSFGSRKGVLWGTFLAVVAIIGLSIFAQLQVMAKQAAAPPSPSQAQVLAAVPEAAAPASGGAAASPANANGSKVFSTNCSSCHGAAGAGVPGAFPPLAKNDTVTGDPNKVIGIVLNGLHGSITINGSTYNGQMPAWKGTLSNADIADVITYIRSSWGNSASAVTEKQVAGYKP